ncbi:SPFH domain-containing protein [Streptomyces sp. NPDC003952]
MTEATMYPTRTTSTTGTFEIPPHPTPRATTHPRSSTTPAEPAGAPEPATGDTAAGSALAGAAAMAAGPAGAVPTATAPGGAAAAAAGAGGAGAEAGPETGATPAGAGPRWGVPAGPDRAGSAPIPARWASAEADAERGARLATAPEEAAHAHAAGRAVTEAATEPGSHLPVEHDRGTSAPVEAGRVSAGAHAERGSHLPVEHDRTAYLSASSDQAVRGQSVSEQAVSEQAVPELASSGRAVAEWTSSERSVSERASSDPAVPERVMSDRAVPEPSVSDRAASDRAASERAASERAVPEWASSDPAASEPSLPERAAPDRTSSERAASDQAASGRAMAGRAVHEPVVAGWGAGSGDGQGEGVGVGAVASGGVVSGAAVSAWAAPSGWALAAEPVAGGGEGSVAAQASAGAPHGSGARSDVPAARVQAEPGVDIPHPQDEAAHAGAATLRLRSPDAETARPHPQGDEAWAPAAAAVRTPSGEGSYAAAEHAPKHAGPPAAWDLPGQGGSAAAQHAVPGPAPEAGSADPAGRREVTWSVPAPGTAGDAGPVSGGPVDGGPGLEAADSDGATAESATAEAGRGVVPGPGVADGGDVAEVVARAVARITEDDTQDLPRIAPAHITPVRGLAVTEVPVHLPFRGAAHPQPTRPQPGQPAQPEAEPRPKPRSAPGRRVPRGDDRLHEHRGPVLPGWIAVAVGGIALAGCAVVLWRAGAVPDALALAFGAEPRPYRGLQARFWPPLAFLGIVALLALGGLGRSRAGHAWVLTLFGRYRGTVRRTGLTWISPLLLRRRVDVRLRHWRSDPMPAVDSGGLALQVVVQVVWQVKDTARATLAVEDHVDYLAEQVESAMARVLSQLPADAFHEDAPTLRDAEAVGDALTRMLAAETEAVGVEVFSAQPTRIEYAPEVADAMRRRRVAAIDAKHRDTVLTSVVDAVDDTVHRLTSRGIVELDDYERKALVKDLTVAFYTGRVE